MKKNKLLYFQEFCLDLQHPNGLGRRRRRSSVFGFGEAIPEPEQLKRRRNFFPVETENARNATEGVDEKVDENETSAKFDDEKSAKIDDNVALTVVVPGGEFYNI